MTVKIGDKVREKGSPEIGEVSRMSSHGALVYFSSSSDRIIPYELLERVTNTQRPGTNWEKLSETEGLIRYVSLPDRNIILDAHYTPAGWEISKFDVVRNKLTILLRAGEGHVNFVKGDISLTLMDIMNENTATIKQPRITATLLSTVTPGMKSIKIQFPQEIEDTLIKQIERALGVKVKLARYGK